MKYIPALDGLRALAVLAVVAHHARAPWFAGGFVGVDVFFVLSGYLITRLLSETQPTLRQFYIRRLRRLTPPLALMIAVYLAVFYVIRPDYQHYVDAGLAILYLSDYAKQVWGLPTYLGHTWSLSVEEHFYLLWPLLFFRFRPSVKVLAWAFVALTAWRATRDGWATFYYAFDSHCTGLVLGCLIAAFPRDKFPAWPGLLALAFVGFYLRAHTEFLQGPGLTVIELASAVAVLGKAPKWLECDLLTYLGKLSYGIYLWHVPVSLVLLEDGYPWQVNLLVSLTSAIALSALSYHTLEAWMRRPRQLSGNAAVGGLKVDV